MKTAILIFTALTLSAPTAFAQAAGAYGAAATQSSAQTSAQALGHARQATASQSAQDVAGATASRNAVHGAASQASSATAQTGKSISHANASATQASNLSAELTQKVSSKNAKAGDPVLARTTSTAQLADGTKLPKGTKLIGKVTEVHPKSAAEHDGHLAFAFDRAVLRDGREVPIHTTLESISAPAAVSAMANGAGDFATEPMAAPVGSAHASGGGGLLGSGRIAAPQSSLVGNTVSGATSRVAAVPAREESATGNALDTTAGVAHNVSGQASAATTAVSNLPGITASGAGSNATALDAHGSNVDLSSGTQMTLSVVAQ